MQRDALGAKLAAQLELPLGVELRSIEVADSQRGFRSHGRKLHEHRSQAPTLSLGDPGIERRGGLLEAFARAHHVAGSYVTEVKPIREQPIVCQSPARQRGTLRGRHPGKDTEYRERGKHPRVADVAASGPFEVGLRSGHEDRRRGEIVEPTTDQRRLQRFHRFRTQTPLVLQRFLEDESSSAGSA